MLKICSKCAIEKPVSSFPERPNSKYKNQISSVCSPCINNYSDNYRKTKEGIVTKIYHAQKRNSIKRGHPIPEYSRNEFRDWLFNQPVFHDLYFKWTLLGHSKNSKPSVDRLDDYKPYIFSNMQVTTWEENRLKVNSDMKGGINNKNSKAVTQFSLNGIYIRDFYSIRQAGRELNIDSSAIAKCCKGSLKTTGGFIFNYYALMLQEDSRK